jgi:hypothetical protein
MPLVDGHDVQSMKMPFTYHHERRVASILLSLYCISSLCIYIYIIIIRIIHVRKGPKEFNQRNRRRNSVLDQTATKEKFFFYFFSSSLVFFSQFASNCQAKLSSYIYICRAEYKKLSINIWFSLPLECEPRSL